MYIPSESWGTLACVFNRNMFPQNSFLCLEKNYLCLGKIVTLIKNVKK